MNSRPKISLVVPIYNNELYLANCLDSLFAQTIANDIEFIFIDDASTDSSRDLLSKLISKCPELNIKTFYNEINLGLSATRGIALQKASGTFIAFCDSDDWVEPNMMELLYNKAIDEKAQIVACPIIYNYGKKKVIKNFENNCFNNLNNQPINTIYYSLCNKLFNREFLISSVNLSVPRYNSWEDLFVTAQAIALAKKTAVCEIPLYNYRLSQSGVTVSSRNHKYILRDLLFYTERLNEWFLSKGNTFYANHQGFLLKLKFISKIKMLRGETIEISRWKSTFPECNKHAFALSKQFALHYRILFKLLDLVPSNICIFFAKILGKNAQ